MDNDDTQITPDPAEISPETGAQEPAENPASDPASAPTPPDPPPAPSPEDRVREAELRAAKLEGQLEALKAKEAPAAPAAPAEPADPEPDPNDFEKYPYGAADEAYIKAVRAWDRREALREFQKQTAAEREAAAIAERQRVAGETFRAAFEKLSAEDRAAVSNSDVKIHPVLGNAAVEAGETGAQLLAHLARNPAELARLNEAASTSPTAALRELGKIEAKIAAEPLANRQSKAPAPIKTVGNNGGNGPEDPNVMDYETYRKWRANGGGRSSAA